MVLYKSITRCSASLIFTVWLSALLPASAFVAFPKGSFSHRTLTTTSANNAESSPWQIRRTQVTFAKAKSDEESYPVDMASTTPELLSSIWEIIVEGCTLTRGESKTTCFPNFESKFTPSFLDRLTAHMDVCKDVCDDFGISVVLVPYSSNGVMKGFTVKSFRQPGKTGTLSNDGNFDFAPDPLWDNDDDWDIIDKQIKEENKKYEEEEDDDITDDFPEIDNKIPEDDTEIIDISKKWVNKIMSDMGICPFTSGPDLAGIPIGNVFYCVDRATTVEDMYARYWKEVVRVEQTDEKELSTTLLIAPEFFIENNELFENFCTTLTNPLELLNIEELLQLVFFHPEWTFRDGGARSGMGAAANYARRSPWPMINILRTNQVRSAQRGIPTGLVYQQNEKTLNNVGAKKLETMLRLRDWSDIEDLKVNRRDMEALRMAQDYQSTGQIDDAQQSVVFDSTPAANKVNKKQMEVGNIVKVIMQALEKRLEGDDGKPSLLSGAETSATMMASDFVLEHLSSLEEKGSQNGSTKKNESKILSEDDDIDIPEYTEQDEESAIFGGKPILQVDVSDDF